MNSPHGNGSTVVALSVSPDRNDHASLQAIFSHSRWRLLTACDLVSAFGVMGRKEVAVVLCHQVLSPGTWMDVLQFVKRLPRSPALIVTSRVADSCLWSEVLNLGGWDVLTKPFEKDELLRAVKVAWDHWHNQAGSPAAAMVG
jgi:DNA-binding response OmpR family regulator